MGYPYSSKQRLVSWVITEPILMFILFLSMAACCLLSKILFFFVMRTSVSTDPGRKKKALGAFTPNTGIQKGTDLESTQPYHFLIAMDLSLISTNRIRDGLINIDNSVVIVTSEYKVQSSAIAIILKQTKTIQFLSLSHRKRNQPEASSISFMNIVGLTGSRR